MCELYTDIVRLAKIYVVNFLTEEAVRKAGDIIHLVDMDKVTLYENLSIGDETWLCISALEEEMDTKPFLCVKAFYPATLQKFLKKFPFGDTILQDLGNVQLTKTKSYTVSTIKRLAKRFPQIKLDSPDSLLFLPRNSQLFFFLLKTFLLLGITKIVMEWRNCILGFLGGKLVR